jgi:soluble lytic murein transglycosylase
MGAFDAGDGKPPRPTFAEIDDALRSDPRIANHPERYKIARADAKARFEEQTQAIKQRDDDAVATAMRGVLQNGGRFSDLPQNVRAAVPPKEIDSVINFAQKISKGDDTTSPWLYSKLANDPMKDPLTGEAMSDVAFFKYRRELSDSDFKHFADERAKRNGNLAGANGPGDLNSAAIKQNLDTNLWQLKIDPSPKGDSDNARVGAIRKFVNDYFVAAQREAGKKFTDSEVSSHINALFAKNETFKGFFSDSKGPMLTMKVGDVPSDEKNSIKAAFKKQGVDSPTDAQIMNAYWLTKVSKR